MKILLFPFAPISNAGARYRFYKIVPFLRAAGHQVVILAPLPDWVFRSLYGCLFGKPRGRFSGKFSEYLRDVLYPCVIWPTRRMQVTRWAAWADMVIVQRELYRAGDWSLENELRKRVPHFVWDYDDALYAVNAFGASGHVNEVIRMADLVLAGNHTLAGYVKELGRPAVVVPTCVDVQRYTSHPNCTAKGKIIVGWVGNPFNLRHFEVVVRALRRVCLQYPEVVIRIVTDGQRDALPGVRLEYKKWSLANEIEDLSSFDIGIMPLIDDEYTRGKCGFKLIQYMAAGLPTVSSPVGVNVQIVRNGVDGVLAATEDEWVEGLSQLIRNPEIRSRLGNEARRVIAERFDIQVAAGIVLESIGVFRQR